MTKWKISGNISISWRVGFGDKKCSWNKKNKVKEQSGRFLNILLGTLGTSLFGKMLVD